MNKLLYYWPGRQRIFCVFVLCCAALPAKADPAYEYNTQGVAEYNAGHWDAAIRSFEMAYEAVPDNATIRRNLCNAHQAAANALAREADFAAAAKHLELAIGIDPENHSPLVQLGSYYLRLDLVPEAIARLEEAIELAPKSVDAHELLGDAYYMDNDAQSALVQWRWVCEVIPDRPGLRQKIEKASREDAVESNFRPSGSRHFQLTYSPEIPARSLRRVVNTLERAYIDIGRNFGGVYPPTPIQVIVYNIKEFADATLAREYVGALYDGKIRIPLADAEGATLSDQDLKERLFHEYTHVVVRFLGGGNVPWWLNEGLAETFSKELGPMQMAILEKAVAEGTLLPLAALNGSVMNKLNADGLRLAYAQSHATVHYLWSKFGQKRLTALMSDLAQGIAPEEALHHNYNRTYAALQKEVRRSLATAGGN
jgi:hypothetical protein